MNKKCGGPVRDYDPEVRANPTTMIINNNKKLYIIKYSLWIYSGNFE